MRKKIIGPTLSAMLFVFCVSADAQQAKVPRVGLLVNGSASNFATRINAFRQGLRDLDYVEGKNIVIEYRYSEGKMDRLSDLAAELVRLKVNLIVTHSALAPQTVNKLTTTIPIVLANVGDAPEISRPAFVAAYSGSLNS
jgi:putative tryptophan/tyrosine transport system substrate-binding protein